MQGDESPPQSWPHAPSHFVSTPGTVMITSGTYGKEHIFRSRKRLRHLCELLIYHADQNGWQMEAWAVFSNHYHWIGNPGQNKTFNSLRSLISNLHRESARWVNELDKMPARKVWHNFFESTLTYEKSYLARLRYVTENAVKHGLVERATDYPWCSASWFEKNSGSSFQKTLKTFKIDRLRVPDDF